MQKALIRKRDAGISCSICSEETIQLSRKFGLLENCSHVFCLECIREWRRQREQDKLNLRKCPICRVESFFIFPSDTVLYGDKKLEEMEKYKIGLSKIKCRYEEGKDSKCPFGLSCLYLHTGGLPGENFNARIARGADGRKKQVKQQSIADYLFS
jgi:Ring finger domain